MFIFNILLHTLEVACLFHLWILEPCKCTQRLLYMSLTHHRKMTTHNWKYSTSDTPLFMLN